jgi:hypothetical protein
MPIDLKNTTCALWLPKDYDLTLIKEVIDSIKGNIISISRKNLLVGLSDVIIFVDREFGITNFFFSDWKFYTLVTPICFSLGTLQLLLRFWNMGEF